MGLLADLLKERDLTQEEFGQRMDPKVSQAAVSKWDGRRGVPLKHQRRAAKVLRCSEKRLRDDYLARVRRRSRR